VIHFPDHHGEAEEGEEEGRPLTWDLDNVELTTVGIDIGSSTSHLLVARLHLQRLAQGLSSRFEVVGRQVLHRSPVRLTPYRADGLIDAEELRRFFDRAYAEAGLTPEAIDTGAVILTGVALERENARAVAELFAGTGGRFVCASAGHNLEAILAARGSGAVEAAEPGPEPRLHLDVGGGTTKLALIAEGQVLETAAIAVGGRLVVLDGSKRVTRVEPAALTAARAAGVRLAEGERLEPEARRRLCAAMAEAALAAVRGDLGGLVGELMLTPPLPRAPASPVLTCSGGVSEYLVGSPVSAVDDLGAELAAALAAAFRRQGYELRPLPAGIRATVVGASQFTVQLSGNTVHVRRPGLLPLRNLPVVHPRLGDGAAAPAVAGALRRAMGRLDLDEPRPLAVALSLPGEPHHRTLRELALGLAEGLGDHLARRLPLVLALDADLGRSLGHVLEEELGPLENLVVIDGLELMELDYVDVGAMVRPAGVVPVVIKSLAFGPAADARG
jgi:ethanolamine utilization protein EutA